MNNNVVNNRPIDSLILSIFFLLLAAAIVVMEMISVGYGTSDPFSFDTFSTALMVSPLLTGLVFVFLLIAFLFLYTFFYQLNAKEQEVVLFYYGLDNNAHIFSDSKGRLYRFYGNKELVPDTYYNSIIYMKKIKDILGPNESIKFKPFIKEPFWTTFYLIGIKRIDDLLILPIIYFIYFFWILLMALVPGWTLLYGLIPFIIFSIVIGYDAYRKWDNKVNHVGNSFELKELEAKEMEQVNNTGEALGKASSFYDNHKGLMYSLIAACFIDFFMIAILQNEEYDIHNYIYLLGINIAIFAMWLPIDIVNYMHKSFVKRKKDKEENNLNNLK